MCILAPVMKVNWYETARRGIFTPLDRIHHDIYSSNFIAGGDQYLQVILDRHEYRPGEEVSGQVILSVVERIPSATVALEVFGEYHSDNLYNGMGRHGVIQQIAHESNRILDEQITLYQLQEDSGQLYIPFSFKLPLDLATSLFWDNSGVGRCWVFYGVRASLRCGEQTRMVDWQEMRISSPLPSAPVGPISIEREFCAVKSIFASNQHALISLSFNQDTYEPGDIIHCQASFDLSQLKVPIIASNLTLIFQMDLAGTLISLPWTADSKDTIFPGSTRQLDYMLEVPTNLPPPCSLPSLKIKLYLCFTAAVYHGTDIIWDSIEEIKFATKSLLQFNEDLIGNEMPLFGEDPTRHVEVPCLPNMSSLVDTVRFIPRRRKVEAGGFLEGIILVKHGEDLAHLQLTLRGRLEVYEKHSADKFFFMEHSVADANYEIDDAVSGGLLLRYPVRIRLDTGLFGCYAQVINTKVGRITYEVTVALMQPKGALIAQQKQLIFVSEMAKQPIHSLMPPMVKSIPIKTMGLFYRGILDTFFCVQDGHLVPGRAATAILSLDNRLAKFSLATSARLTVHLRRIISFNLLEAHNDVTLLLDQNVQLASPQQVNLILKLPIPPEMEPSVSHDLCKVEYALEVKLPMVIGCKLELSQPMQMVAPHHYHPPDYSSHFLDPIFLGTAQIVIP